MTRDEERFGVQLGLLVEAGGKVQAAAGRIMRWGLGAVDVVSNESNRDALLREMEDMRATMRRIERELSGTLGELPSSPPVLVEGPAPVANLADGTALSVEVVDTANGH